MDIEQYTHIYMKQHCFWASYSLLLLYLGKIQADGNKKIIGLKDKLTFYVESKNHTVEATVTLLMRSIENRNFSSILLSN